MNLLALLLIGVLWAVIWDLRKRVRGLEARIDGLTAAGAAGAAIPRQPGQTPAEAAAAAQPAPAPEVADPAPAAGPWDMPAAPAPAPAGPVAAGPRPPSLAARAAAWATANWVYVLAALSLVFAGVFLVQYGIERGLLPPAARVAAALALGAALVVAGEAIRRRWGDTAGATARLPSTFSGAGVASLFIGVFAARQLYGLIGPGPAFVGFLGVAALAVVLGWLHGPFLIAVGLLGAAATPFLAGGGQEAPAWLPLYYVLVAATGLAVDTMRRWAWVSVLALVLGLGGIWLVQAGGADPAAATVAAMLVPLLALAIPARSPWPDQTGTSIGRMLRRRLDRPPFPVRLAAGAMLAASLLILAMPGAGLAAYAALALLAGAVAIWAIGAPAVADLVAIPAAGFLARLAVEPLSDWPLARRFAAAAADLRAPETAAPLTVSVIAGLAVAVGLAAFLRSLRGRDNARAWSAMAAAFPAAALVLLEAFWTPAAVLGAGLWAGHVIAAAAVAVFMAERLARADGGPGPRAAHAVLAGLTLVALALFVVLDETALTVAMAVLIVVAALLDRRLRLPEMALFIQAAVAVLGWRLIIDPGIGWAMDAGPGGTALWEVLLSFAAPVGACVLAWLVLRGIARPGARLALESAAIGFAAVLANVLLARMLTEARVDIPVHALAALMAMPWLVGMFAQIHRRGAGGRVVRALRGLLAGVNGLLGFGLLAAGATVGNPVVDLLGSDAVLVRGPVMLDTLLLAYALPAALLLAGVRLVPMARSLRRGFLGAAALLGVLWAGLEIRRIWHGPDLRGDSVVQGELYSYTLAMLAIGAGLLYLALSRRSIPLRRAAMAVIALTVAKVFLIDAAGLSGLTRVAAFLGLGLSLAGVAWLNRWAALRQGDDPAAGGGAAPGAGG